MCFENLFSVQYIYYQIFVFFVIYLAKKAEKQLDKLPDNIAEPIIEAIARLSIEPRPSGHIKLKGRDGYRIRSGHYRILYSIFDHQLIVDIGKIFISSSFPRYEINRALTHLYVEWRVLAISEIQKGNL